MKVKEERENAGLKLSNQKTKIMASSLITSCQIDGETTERMRDFTFLGSKITTDGDCRHKIKRHLLLGEKKIHEQPRQHVKSRDIAFPTKVCLVKLWFFQ